MNAQPASVSRSHIFELRCASGAVCVAALLEYTQDEPYAVTAAFRTGTSDTVRWDFARDLLIEGLIEEAGAGDIVVAPCDDDPSTIMIELRSPDGTALLAADAADLAEFLTATYAVVAVGAEDLTSAIDTELAALLTNGAH
jgi:hypothetical protein